MNSDASSKSTPSRINLITNGRKPHNVSRQPSRRTIIKHIFGSFGSMSSMHGVGHLVNSTNSCRAFVYWMILVLFGLTMVVIHLHLHIQNVIKSPIATDILHETRDFVFPDVSFCSLQPTTRRMYNRVERRHFRGLYREDAIILGAILESDQIINFRENFYTSKLIQRQLIARQRATYSSHKRSFHPANEMIFDCTYRGIPCGDQFELLNDPVYWNCYTFRPKDRTMFTTSPSDGLVIVAYTATEDIRKFKNNMVKFNTKHTFFTQTNLSADLTTDDQQQNFFSRVLLDKLEPSGIKITIHEANTLPTSKEQGFILTNGMYARISLEMYDEQRLNRSDLPCSGEPATYSFRQRLNSKTGKEEFTHYKLDETTCKALIKQNELLRQCGCISYIYPIEENHSYTLCYNYTDVLQTILNYTNVIALPNWELLNSTSMEIAFFDAVDKGQRLFNSSHVIYDAVMEFKHRIKCHDSFVSREDEETEITKADKLNTDKLNHDNCPLNCHSSIYKYQLSSAPWPRDCDLLRLMGEIILPQISANRHMNMLEPEFLPIADEILDINPYNRTEWNTSTWMIDRNFVRLVIHPTKLRSNVHQERETYTVFEALSEVGGILGLWLGMSILTVFEVIEMIWQLFYGLCMPRKMTHLLSSDVTSSDHTANFQTSPTLVSISKELEDGGLLTDQSIGNRTSIGNRHVVFRRNSDLDEHKLDTH